jgi:hypothetical protein
MNVHIAFLAGIAAIIVDRDTAACRWEHDEHPPPGSCVQVLKSTMFHPPLKG